MTDSAEPFNELLHNVIHGGFHPAGVESLLLLLQQYEYDPDDDLGDAIAGHRDYFRTLDLMEAWENGEEPAACSAAEEAAPAHGT